MNLVRQPDAGSLNAWGRSTSLRLAQGMNRLGLKPHATQIERLHAYGALLLKWNRTYNLLGATSADSLVDDHLLDSLAILPVLARWITDPSNSTATGAPASEEFSQHGRRQLVDVGSGAGLPGLVLAIMLEDLDVTLIEPIGKKTAFLRQAVAECNLSTVRVLEAKLEDLTRKQLAGIPVDSETENPGQTDFICRAFTSLGRFAELCGPFLQPGSILFAMKSVRVTQELEQLDSSIEVLAVEPLETLGKEVQRNLVVMRAPPRETASATTQPAR